MNRPTDARPIPATERRVYHLPAALVVRLQTWQASQGIPSETEAARQLLGEALDRKDTPGDVMDAARAAMQAMGCARQAARAIGAHPHVSGLLFKGNDVQITFGSGEAEWVLKDAP